MRDFAGVDPARFLGLFGFRVDISGAASADEFVDTEGETSVFLDDFGVLPLDLLSETGENLEGDGDWCLFGLDLTGETDLEALGVLAAFCLRGDGGLA